MLNNNEGFQASVRSTLENIVSLFSVLLLGKGWNFLLVNILRSSGALKYNVGTVWSVTSEWPLIQRVKRDRIKTIRWLLVSIEGRLLNTGLLIIRGKKNQNFAGFSGENLRKNQPISRDFRGKKVKIGGKIGRFRGIFAGKSQNSRRSRPISRDFSGKKNQISKDFQGQILRKIGRFHGKFRGETSPRNNQ